MTLLHAIILGIVEGLTELLPVSSTAHLMVTSAVLGIDDTALLTSFLIAVQLGAVIAVALYYVRRIVSSHVLWKKVLAAFIPTALIGFILYDVVKGFLLESILIAGIALIVGGIVMILVERFVAENDRHDETAVTVESLSYPQAVMIGCIQTLALIPGVSRSGATIIGGRLMKIHRRTLVEFSFLLAIPVIAGAVGLDLIKTDLSGVSSHMILLILVGMLVAGLTTWAVIRWFIRYIERHTFVAFGWYRIIFGTLLVLFVILG